MQQRTKYKSNASNVAIKNDQIDLYIMLTGCSADHIAGIASVHAAFCLQFAVTWAVSASKSLPVMLTRPQDTRSGAARPRPWVATCKAKDLGFKVKAGA